MKLVIDEFDSRVKEIDLYFDFIHDIIVNEAMLFFPNKKRGKQQAIDSELTKILKANAFLLLYNLVESSIKKSIEEIYVSLNNENTKYGLVSDAIKKKWIEVKYSNFKKEIYVSEKIFDCINNMENDIISMNFNSAKTIKGNIDSKKVRDFSDEYGFSTSSHHTTKKGEKLFLVKNKRNDLAHGTISFCDCGKEYTIDEILIIKKQVVSYVRSILKNVSKFIQEKKYLKATA